MKRNRNKYFAFSLITVFVVFGLLEMISYGGLYALSQIRRVNYMPILSREMSEEHKRITAEIVKNVFTYTQFDSLTGWSIAPDKSHGVYQSNSQGLRGNENYDMFPPFNKIRIATFGDSFTHCDEVRNDETWQYYMEQNNPEFQVLNLGVGGYGTDQAFLRYQAIGKKFNADVVLIGFMPENIKRHVNVYRAFYMSGTLLPLTKPRFKVVDRKLTLIPNPIKRAEDYQALLENTETMFRVLGTQDYHYHVRYHQGPFDFLALVRLSKMIGSKVFQANGISDLWGVYNPNSEAFMVTLKIIETFYEEVLEDGKIPIIVILPYKEDILRFKDDEAVNYQPLLAALIARNLIYIDGLNAFSDDFVLQDYQGYFRTHYSPKGNLLVSQFLAREIKAILRKHPVRRAVTGSVDSVKN